MSAFHTPAEYISLAKQFAERAKKTDSDTEKEYFLKQAAHFKRLSLAKFDGEVSARPVLPKDKKKSRQ